MADDTPPRAPRPVHDAALAFIVRRLSRAPQAPWLHREVARRMAERLSLVRLQPHTVLDWWSFNGASQPLLQQAYPRCRMRRVELDPPLPERAPVPTRWWLPRRAAGQGAAGCVAPQAVAAGEAELLWANMMLHLVGDPGALMLQWRRALALDGFLMFSTLGPGTLAGLRAAYARQNWPAAHAPFVDMHDLGDMLLHAGFAAPVMDQEIITLTWPDPRGLLDELRSVGGNADLGRWPGLRTPRWRERLYHELAQLAGPDGRPRLEFEVVYGHAFAAAPKARTAMQTTLALDEVRAMVRSSRRGAPPERQSG